LRIGRRSVQFVLLRRPALLRGIRKPDHTALLHCPLAAPLLILFPAASGAHRVSICKQICIRPEGGVVRDRYSRSARYSARSTDWSSVCSRRKNCVAGHSGCGTKPAPAPVKHTPPPPTALKYQRTHGRVIISWALGAQQAPDPSLASDRPPLPSRRLGHKNIIKGPSPGPTTGLRSFLSHLLASAIPFASNYNFPTPRPISNPPTSLDPEASSIFEHLLSESGFRDFDAQSPRGISSQS
jgi:hypothetical protein